MYLLVQGMSAICWKASGDGPTVLTVTLLKAKQNRSRSVRQFAAIATAFKFRPASPFEEK